MANAPRLAEDLALAQLLADTAGDAIRPFYRAEFGLEDKADASPVTAADRAAEGSIRQILQRERPSDGILGEEYGAERSGASRCWVIDPIDGTSSFIVGRPIFGTLIALLIDGFPVLGIVDQPILRERWTGAMGEPTRFNGQVARTRRCPSIDQAVLATTSPHAFDAHQGEHFLSLASKVAPRRIIYGGDCYNYALLASGHVDIVCEANLHLHDFAALVPIVEGAGGLMCDWAGEPLHAASGVDGSGGHAIALGDPARLEEVLEGLACTHS
ncbi:MAG: inositol monophosphatase family protein [Sphingomonadaceae bacterium]|nr:inositol monophosphatase family protein [Sphingomonadaceae bacterium]